MRRKELTVLVVVVGLTIASPAHALMNMPMSGMSMPGMKMPATKKPSAKSRVSKNSASKRVAQPRKVPVKPSQARTKIVGRNKSSKPSHDRAATAGMAMPSGQEMSSMPGMIMPPVPGTNAISGSASPAQSIKTTMPGMAMPSGSDMNMTGMSVSNSSALDASGTNLPAGNASPPPVPLDRAADQVYGSAAMAMGLHHLREFHGGQKMSQLLINIAEYHFNRGRDGYQWVGQGWYGGDINRLWVKSQGDGEFRRGVSRGEVQGLFSHAIGPYFNLQGGVRHDFKPNPSRTYATVGIEGLAPSFFDVEAALFLSNKGELMGRVEASYDQRITQRLILQPRIEVNAAAQNNRAIGVGSGLSDIEAGLRLRYDVRREFAPYLGVQYKRAFGATGRYLSNDGERRGSWSFLTGIRTWF